MAQTRHDQENACLVERSLQEICLLLCSLLLLSFVNPLKDLARCAKVTHMDMGEVGEVGEGSEWKEGKGRE